VPLLLAWLAVALPACALRDAAGSNDPVPGVQTNTGPERYASWFGDSDGRILYFGLSPFLELWARCEEAGEPRCPLRDLDEPGDHLIGRFDLQEERFLAPLVVRPLEPLATSSVWDVLAHSNGRIYYTTFWDELGSVLPDGSDVRHYRRAGMGLNELWEGPGGEIYATRYIGSMGRASDENGGIVVFGPDGTRRREFPFRLTDGVQIAPKSVAVDPCKGDVWVTTDIFFADGRPIGHDLLRLSATGEILERQVEPEVDFVSFDAAGRGWFAERTADGFAVRIAAPDGGETRIDLGPRRPIDFVQDIKHAGDITLLTTWGTTVYAVREGPAGRFDATTLEPATLRDCPPGPVAGYTAVVAPGGAVYETVTCGIRVIRVGVVRD